MPLLATLIEDTSPILQFSATEWRAGTSESDGTADQYTESTFSVSDTQGATMKLEFNGTGVELFGARRNNHGSYIVNLDGTDSPSISGFSNNSLFNQSLYSSNGLVQGIHKLQFTNQGSGSDPFVDIDYVVIQTHIGNDTEDMIMNTFQDMHPTFTYTPPSSWHSPNLVSSFSGATGHATVDPSASMTMFFNGDGIAIYGPVGPNQTTSYSVQIDDGKLVSALTANYQFYRPQQILYFATNLGGGNHTITMKTTGLQGSELAIDYANVYTTTSLGGSFSLSQAASNQSGTSTIQPVPTPQVLTVTRVPNGVYAALALTSTCTLAGLICFGYFFWLKLRRKPSARPGDQVGRQDPQTMEPFVSTSNDAYSYPQASQPSRYLKQGAPTVVNHTPSNSFTTSSGMATADHSANRHSRNPPAYGMNTGSDDPRNVL